MAYFLFPNPIRAGLCLLAAGALACSRTFRPSEMERSLAVTAPTVQKRAEEEAAMEAAFAPQSLSHAAWEVLLEDIGFELEEKSKQNELKPEVKLHHAAWLGQMDLLQKQCEKNNCYLDYVVGVEKVTPLHLAVYRGSDNCTQLLLNQKATVSFGMKPSGIQPLHIAASQGNVSVLIRLLQAGASVEAIDAMGRTALHWAAAKGSTGCIHELLQAGSSLNQSDDRNDSPLCLALRYGHTFAVKQLIREGGIVDCLYCMGGSSDYVARWALVHGHDSCLEALTNRGTAVLDAQKKDAYGTTLWQLALRKKRRIGLQCLLRRTADLDYRDAQGNTLFHLALQEGFIGSLDLLSGVLPDILNTPNHAGQTPLHRAAMDKNTEAIRVLLALPGIDVNAKNEENDTPLHTAILFRHFEAINWLLAARADVNARNNQDQTPLHKATVVYKNIEIVRTLLAWGAEVNAKNKYGETPLHKAALFGHVEVIRALLVTGAEVNAKNKYGDTPLHIAATSGHPEAIRVLLAEGAKVNMKNNDGDTPLATAQSKGYFEVVDLLRQAGAW